MELDEEKNTLTYDFLGNRMVVTQPKEDTFPRLQQPKLGIPGRRRRESQILNSTSTDFMSRGPDRRNSIKYEALNDSSKNVRRNSQEIVC